MGEELTRTAFDFFRPGATPEGVYELASNVGRSEEVVVVEHVGGTPALGATPLLPAPPNIEVGDQVPLCRRKPVNNPREVLIKHMC